MEGVLRELSRWKMKMKCREKEKCRGGWGTAEFQMAAVGNGNEEKRRGWSVDQLGLDVVFILITLKDRL